VGVGPVEARVQQPVAPRQRRSTAPHRRRAHTLKTERPRALGTSALSSAGHASAFGSGLGVSSRSSTHVDLGRRYADRSRRLSAGGVEDRRECKDDDETVEEEAEYTVDHHAPPHARGEDLHV
jgi:hypothetical protein